MTDKPLFIVAVDESAGAARAAEHAAREAVLHGGTLLLVHVVEWSRFEVLPVRDLEVRHGHKEKALAQARKNIMAPLANRLVVSELEVATRIEFGHGAETVVEVARECGAGQIFVGRHAGSHATERFLGSMPTNLVRLSPVPVTVVP
ncbi:MAG: universal stress protein [Alphaproteobacteria bacterium]|nr:MAG: universal stress protein [Alphaproteobacteria bacterium]